ncbi:MAG: protein-glutamine glutaminase family protein [Oligoflexia bacterium]|nr:protein-glutamine glutaminase family protein [Oligoflexia bacterium]
MSGGTLKTQTLSTPLQSQVQVSILDRAQARLLMDFFQTRLPFRYPGDCCHDRALMVSHAAAKAGLPLAKVFVEGDFTYSSEEWGRVKWSFHVAPLVLSPEGEYLILDNSLSPEPLALSEWLGLFAEGGYTISIANAFTYGPEQIASDPRAFLPSDIEIASLSLMGCDYLARRGNSARSKP